MTPHQFRRLALSLPGAAEGSHLGTTDFRVAGKIFATLGNPDAGWGVVGLTPDQQALLRQTAAETFVAVPGAWGRRGWTRVRLAAADRATAENALRMAWRNRAPKSLQGEAAKELMAERARPAVAKSKSGRKK